MTTNLDPHEVRMHREFRKAWNQMLNVNKYLLHHGPALKLTKAIAWDAFKKTGELDFKAALNKAGRIKVMSEKQKKAA